MPFFRERWLLDPEGTGVVVGVAAQQTLAGPLNTIGDQVEGADGNVYLPLSTITIRVRFRQDVSQRSLWVGPDGRTWRTNEVLKVGRDRYLDVSLSTYDVPDATFEAPGDPDYEPPTGWLLQYRRPDATATDAVYDPPRFVDQLEVRDIYPLNTYRGTVLCFSVTVPPGGFAVAAGVNEFLVRSSDANEVDNLDVWVPAYSRRLGPASRDFVGFQAASDGSAVVGGNDLSAGAEFPLAQNTGFIALRRSADGGPESRPLDIRDSGPLAPGDILVVSKGTA